MYVTDAILILYELLCPKPVVSYAYLRTVLNLWDGDTVKELQRILWSSGRRSVFFVFLGRIVFLG